MAKHIGELADSGGVDIDNDLFIVRRDAGTPQDYKVTFADLVSAVRATETADITYDVEIASGSITVDPLHAPTTAYHIVDSEGASGADDLDTIVGTKMGQLLTLQIKDNGRAITVKDGVGNIFLAGGDFTMNSVKDAIQLVYNSNLNQWSETRRSDVA